MGPKDEKETREEEEEKEQTEQEDPWADRWRKPPPNAIFGDNDLSGEW